MSTRRQMTVWCVALAAAAGVALYFALDPSSRPFPRCMFLTLTGLECPGCGSQRALHALLHGRVGEAWALNPLMLAELPLIGLLMLAEGMPGRFPRMRRVLTSRSFILTLLTVIIIWTIYRNL